MKNTRRSGRESALRSLYAREMHNAMEDVTPEAADYLCDTDADDEGISIAQRQSRAKTHPNPFADLLVKGVLANLDFINATISACSENWRIERMSYVDRNILRIAVFEIFFLPEVPSVVSINEAIEIAKKYSDREAPAFINGILNRVKEEYEKNCSPPQQPGVEP